MTPLALALQRGGRPLRHAPAQALPLEPEQRRTTGDFPSRATPQVSRADAPAASPEPAGSLVIPPGCVQVARHLVDWQQATAGHRVLALTNFADPHSDHALQALNRQLSVLAGPQFRELDLGVGAGPVPWLTSPPVAQGGLVVAKAQHLTLLNGTRCPAESLQPWLTPGAVDGLLEIHQASRGSVTPTWECRRLAAGIPLVGVIEIRPTVPPGPTPTPCT